MNEQQLPPLPETEKAAHKAFQEAFIASTGYPPTEFETWLGARAALEQLRCDSAKAEPAGWKLVPVEPTQAMHHAGIKAMPSDPNAAHWWAGYPLGCWAAMLAATPPESHVTRAPAPAPEAKPAPAETSRLLDEIATTMERQIELIEARAKGAYVDKVPVLRSLRSHVRKARTALAADDQAWDRNAERLTRKAFGLGGGINPNATSVDDLFLDDEATPAQAQQADDPLAGHFKMHIPTYAKLHPSLLVRQLATALMVATEAEAKPLTDDRLYGLWEISTIKFARAIERACAEAWGVKLSGSGPVSQEIPVPAPGAAMADK